MEIGGYRLPVGDGVECAAVVVVAMTPVGGVEGGFFGAEDLLEALPGSRVGWAAEDHAVVEEDGADGGICLRHVEVIVRECVERRTIEVDGWVA